MSFLQVLLGSRYETTISRRLSGIWQSGKRSVQKAAGLLSSIPNPVFESEPIISQQANLKTSADIYYENQGICT
uniref:Uncharacterized protein n=1 Tax=Arundo donax TaxID=35708 RepID=A0A0A9EMX8_ARUDO